MQGLCPSGAFTDAATAGTVPMPLALRGKSSGGKTAVFNRVHRVSPFGFGFAHDIVRAGTKFAPLFGKGVTEGDSIRSEGELHIHLIDSEVVDGLYRDPSVSYAILDRGNP